MGVPVLLGRSFAVTLLAVPYPTVARWSIWRRGHRLLALALLLVAGALLSPRDRDGGNVFLSVGNQADVLRQVSSNGILAVGMTLVVLTGGIDLAVGTTMALGSTVTARLLMDRGTTSVLVASSVALSAWTFLLTILLVRRLLPHARPYVPPTLAGLVCALLCSSLLSSGAGLLGALLSAPALGALCGLASGALVARGSLQPFIATLAMMITVLGAGRLLAGTDQMVHPIYFGPDQAPEAFRLLRERIFDLVPVPGLVFLAVAALAALLLNRTSLGRHIFAVGGNEEAARLSGVPVVQTKLFVYSICGLLAGLTGVLYAAQYTQGKPDAGTGWELDAIAAVVIGGTSLRGGVGSVGGTLIGVLLFGYLANILQLQNVDSSRQLVVKGLLIVGAVLLQEGKLRLGFLRRSP
ncbi:MAG: ABC transporter permease [Planctomycetes bacterium]|nr:ABC transporter permease [Planctomycetota bacterium]